MIGAGGAPTEVCQVLIRLFGLARSSAMRSSSVVILNGDLSDSGEGKERLVGDGLSDDGSKLLQLLVSRFVVNSHDKNTRSDSA